jgi:D-arginine dehydrogenase
MKVDIVIIGAGMAGAAAAFHLARADLNTDSRCGERIILLEGEAQPGYHSTGRSAALYEPCLGNATVRAFNVASAKFLNFPPAGFADRPLMSRRGELTIADEARRDALDQVLALDGLGGHEIREIAAGQARAMIPILRPDQIRWAAYEPDVMDMDVNAIHQGFLKGFSARGGRLLRDAPVRGIERRPRGWRIEAGAESFEADIVVNAAGAWADDVAVLAGLAPLGLQPKRRTAAILPAPEGLDIHGWPVFGVAGEPGYFKPEAGKLLVSPGDATPVPPQDVQPEELDVAHLVDWFESRTTLTVRRVERRWAGLRTFAPDNSPVLGEDPAAPGFWWLAGQGGYGIMMAESLARSLARLMLQGELPEDLRVLGVTAAAVAPHRLRG